MLQVSILLRPVNLEVSLHTEPGLHLALQDVDQGVPPLLHQEDLAVHLCEGQLGEEVGRGSLLSLESKGPEVLESLSCPGLHPGLILGQLD